VIEFLRPNRQKLKEHKSVLELVRFVRAYAEVYKLMKVRKPSNSKHSRKNHKRQLSESVDDDSDAESSSEGGGSVWYTEQSR
jgi:hypothetical protein